MFRDTLKINQAGRLEIGGVDTSELAQEFGTPLYALDEAHMRSVCREYRRALSEEYPDSLVCYASKAFSSQAIYRIVGAEGLGADAVSAGELYTMLTAGFDMDTVYFHGNNKLPYEVDMAITAGVHAIVADGDCDLELLEAAAVRAGKRPKVLLRINPGIEAHTHESIQTARPDSKFGVSIAGGAALALVGKFLSCEAVEFVGLHCHIGSQIFMLEPFCTAVEKVTDFLAEVKARYGAELSELNLGGGFGIRYTEADCPCMPADYVSTVAGVLTLCAKEKNLRLPRLILEPGRSIVGEAGITLYTVGAIKEIAGIRKYISVDGGMGDNPRYALYKAEYSAVLANRASGEPTETVTVAGKCCESGDILIENIRLPQAKRGDLLAVFCTGAYNYSMASHYNRNFIPPVVLVNEGKAEYIVRPETLEDLIARDVIPARLNKRGLE